MSFQALKISGPVAVIFATGISGAAGYFVIWYVPFSVGFQEASQFVLFWSVLFFIVGVASGVQQEISRAVTPGVTASLTKNQTNRVLGYFVLVINGIFVICILILNQQQLLNVSAEQHFLAPLLIGVVGYISFAVLMGIQYGTHSFGLVSIGLLVESLSRLLLIIFMISGLADGSIYWAISAPYWVSSVVLLLLFLVRKSSQISIDVSLPKLFTNTLKTMVASFSIAIMMSGFPLIVYFMSQGILAGKTSFLIVISTFLRAPLMIIALALQSLLIVFFKSKASNSNAIVTKFIVALICIGLLGSAVFALFGGDLAAFIFPSAQFFSLEPLVFASLVLSSALLASLTVSGAAALARSMHTIYFLGWLIAAVITIVLAIIPMAYVLHLALALLVGPLAGLVYVIYALKHPQK